MMYENELYLVTYLSGCSGNFLQDILILYLSKYEKPISYKHKVNAHHSPIAGIFNNGYRLRNLYIPSISFIDQIYPISKKPIVLAEHNKSNLDKLFSTYPNAKNILIQIDERSYFRKTVNMHFKWFLDDYKRNPSTEYLKKYWDELINMNPDLKNYNIDTAPLNELIIGLRNQAKFQLSKIPEMHSSSYNPPIEYKDKILTLNYYDVIHNKDHVLESISNFIQYPTKPCIVETYNNYLERQVELFPWLKDD